MQTSAQKAQALRTSLNTLLARRAEVDEKIAAVRATISGVSLGLSLAAEAQNTSKKAEPED